MKNSSKYLSLVSLNYFGSKLLMPIIAVLFLLDNTIINVWVDGHIETLQNICVVIILCIVMLNVFELYRSNNIHYWLKKNSIVVIYFLARTISVYNSGFDYSAIRTVFLELFFLIGICNITVNGHYKKNDIYIKSFIFIEIFFTLLSTGIHYITPHLNDVTYNIIGEYTNYHYYHSAALFTNVNAAGIMAGFSIILGIILYNEGVYNKKWIGIFCLYNVYLLILYNCRASIIGVIISLLFGLLRKYVFKISIKKYTIIALLLMISTLVPIYSIIGHYDARDQFTYEQLEQKIDVYSSGRYAIWKECYTTQKDDLFFGKGSLKVEKQVRINFIENIKLPESVKERYKSVAQLGPHNGYISMISVTGWVGFVLFIVILIQRIKKATILEGGEWYLFFVFIFTINCFESLFIVNNFFTCFYMFFMLEVNVNEKIYNYNILPQSEVSK